MLTTVLCIILLVIAVANCVLVMMQSGKDTKLSGTIAGGADTYFGKNKSTGKDKLLSNITAALSVAFAILVVAIYIIG